MLFLATSKIRQIRLLFYLDHLSIHYELCNRRMRRNLAIFVEQLEKNSNQERILNLEKMVTWSEVALSECHDLNLELQIFLMMGMGHKESMYVQFCVNSCHWMILCVRLCSVVVITSASHAEGSQFDPGWRQHIYFSFCKSFYLKFALQKTCLIGVREHNLFFETRPLMDSNWRWLYRK